MSENKNRETSSGWGWATALAGAAALAGGLYYVVGSRPVQTQTRQDLAPGGSRERRVRDPPPTLSNILQFLQDMSANDCGVQRRSTAPQNPVINNLNALLEDIYVRFIVLLPQENHYYYIFCEVFRQLQEKMKEVDPYYRKYSSRKQFAGSHFDNLRIKKPDEFDMDIVIDLPLNFNVDPHNPEKSDIVIEAKSPGFVQLKMGSQYQRLPMRDGAEWQVNKTAYEWRDNRDYLLRSKFTDWFKSAVQRALNTFKCNGQTVLYVQGAPFTIRLTESGPAATLIIENRSKAFKLDVDLVPALKFPENRWPVSRCYKNIPAGCNREDWMVVPKPNKAASNDFDQSRSWRVALHDQEKMIMYNAQNLKKTIKLIKQLRDAQGMKKIASYYIKTLFFWEVTTKNDPTFWRTNSPATLFKIMVQRFHEAMVKGSIPYFWNKDNNLIGNVDRNTLNQYEKILAKLLEILNQPQNYKRVASYLLTPQEFVEYNMKFLHI